MRILFDTNIFIHIDADSGRSGKPIDASLDQACLKLCAIANRHGVTLCLSEATKDDLQKGRDATAMIKKMKKFEIVGLGIKPKPEYWNNIGKPPKIGSNNFRDDCILNLVNVNAVHFLVTSDQGIINKARLLGLSDRVFLPQECVDYLQILYEQDYKIMPEVEDVELCKISLNQDIFGSLIKDYPQFKVWYENKAKDGRKAWVIGALDNLSAIAIYDTANNGYNGQMKICTFKVSENVRREKLGELLLKQILTTAKKLKKNEIFIEVAPDKADFIGMLEGFGFGKDKEDEIGGIRQLIMKRKVHPNEHDYKSNSESEFLRKFYPYCKLPPQVKAYILPIRPEFAQNLFSDVLEQARLPIGSYCADRAIKKVYISNSNIKKLKTGDLLFFYMCNKDRALKTQVIITMGVIDDICITDDINTLLSFAGKRTVYVEQQLLAFLRDGKKALAVKFWHIDCIAKPIDLKAISALKAPQTFATIPTASYNTIASHTTLK